MVNDDTKERFLLAISRGDTETFNELLNKDSSLLSAKYTNGHTPLHEAARAGRLDIANTRLRLAPEMAIAKDSDGETAMHAAVAEGHLDLITALAKVAPESLLLGERLGRTPLHVAVLSGKNEAAILLLKLNPALASIETNRGTTALSLARNLSNCDPSDTNLNAIVTTLETTLGTRGLPEVKQTPSTASVSSNASSANSGVALLAQHNKGGIGGSIAGFLVGLMTGNPLFMALGLLMGFIAGNIGVDGESGVASRIMNSRKASSLELLQTPPNQSYFDNTSKTEGLNNQRTDAQMTKQGAVAGIAFDRSFTQSNGTLVSAPSVRKEAGQRQRT